MIWVLDDFQGPLDFHGHGSWFVCEDALISTIAWIICFLQGRCAITLLVFFFLSSREKISQLGLTPFSFGYLSIVI
jgi:hypothetical protein